MQTSHALNTCTLAHNPRKPSPKFHAIEVSDGSNCTSRAAQHLWAVAHSPPSDVAELLADLINGAQHDECMVCQLKARLDCKAHCWGNVAAITVCTAAVLAHPITGEGLSNWGIDSYTLLRGGVNISCPVFSDPVVLCMQQLGQQLSSVSQAIMDSVVDCTINLGCNILDCSTASLAEEKDASSSSGTCLARLVHKSLLAM